MAFSKATGFQTLTVSSSALALPSIPTGANAPPVTNVAVVSVEAAPIRYRVDGTAPTINVGTLVPTGGSFTVDSELSGVQMIRQTGVDAVVMVDYRSRGGSQTGV